MTLHNDNQTALAEESLALASTTINCLPLPGLCGLHECNRNEVPCTAAAYDGYTKKTDHVIVACDSDVTAPGMWAQFPRPPSEWWQLYFADVGWTQD